MHIAARIPQAASGRQSGSRSGLDSQEPAEAAFDRWLHDRLGRLYDPILKEPVPESLRALLNQAGQQ